MSSKKKAPAWGSKKMQKAIRRHDRGFARKYGGPKPKRGGFLSWLRGGSR